MYNLFTQMDVFVLEEIISSSGLIVGFVKRQYRLNNLLS